MVKRQIGSAAYPQFKGLGCKTSGGRLLCTDRSGTETFPNKQKCAGYIPEHCLPICKKRKERIKFMRDLEKVCIQPKYNYCTGEERFTFIKLPKCLVEDEGFVELSMDAKLLYAFFLDRVSLSIKNGWIDNQPREGVYLLFNKKYLRGFELWNSKGMQVIG